MGAFVVYLLETDQVPPFKVFSKSEDADAYAKSAVKSDLSASAEIYLVAETDDARAAVAAVQTGNGKLLFQRSRQRTSEEIKRDNDLAWKKAQEEGPDAMLAYLGL